MKVAMLGWGFIARFYADTLHSQRRIDTIQMVYSRNEEVDFASAKGKPWEPLQTSDWRGKTGSKRAENLLG